MQILKVQKEFIPELKDKDLLIQCIESLYQSNEIRRNILNQKDFTYLFAEDILFYQRSLKTKKYLISNCPYETRNYKDKDDNKKEILINFIRESKDIKKEDAKLLLKHIQSNYLYNYSVCSLDLQSPF